MNDVCSFLLRMWEFKLYVILLALKSMLASTMGEALVISLVQLADCLLVISMVVCRYQIQIFGRSCVQGNYCPQPGDVMLKAYYPSQGIPYFPLLPTLWIPYCISDCCALGIIKCITAPLWRVLESVNNVPMINICRTSSSSYRYYDRLEVGMYDEMSSASLDSESFSLMYAVRWVLYGI